MDRIKAYLGQKVGFLPIWAWAFIGLLAILAYFYFSKSGILAGAPAPSATGSSTSPTSALGDLLGGVGGGGAGVAPPATSSDTTIAPTAGNYYGSYGGTTTDFSSGVGAGQSGSSNAPVVASVGGNYNPAYAMSVTPPGGTGTSGSGLANALVSVPLLGRIVAPSVPSFQSFNPVVPRSHGTQAV